ncbi:hypothetical protein B0J11DRAFT_108280 [Dendryphion nanum]|uniref:Uncharacterized protein n=1 Tax=Dendryphion nanum TaxID=256645 RepID=A0A9P9DE22_9PLEO|nr:hypothetical protein B0J11DRAFT_108280 [Dendryphion nanum]
MASDRRPLIGEGSEISDSNAASAIERRAPTSLPTLGFSPQSHSLGFNAFPHVSPPTSPRRPGYSRLLSDTTAVERSTPPTVHEEDEGDGDATDNSGSSRKSAGLGIASPTTVPTRRVSVQSIRRIPVGVRSPSVKSPEIFSPPNTGDPFLGGFPQDSAASTPDLTRDRFSPSNTPIVGNDDFRRGAFRNGQRNEGNEGNEDYQAFLHSGDSTRIRKGAPSMKSAYENDFRPTQECPTTRDFYQSRFSWVSITIVLICLFSTVFSGIFLGLALKKPRYGRSISSQGHFKPADAILLTSVMAKLIELSFVTSFVAFLGQVLSRRAFMKEQGRGVTLSDLSMWRWVVQPGTLITHWETAKYSGLTVLGILSLLSAVLATLYAPAATALVQPMLKDGAWEYRTLVGGVKTVFANPAYISKICPTPIRSDTEHAGSTCLQIEHAGQGYHNYQRYLAYWDIAARNGNGTTDQKRRPPGFGLLYENTTITAQWINVVDTKAKSKEYNRGINNVSLAMPHAGVFAAARDQRNGIMQPEELDSEGTYSLRASVPSLVMNVICANMDKTELEPIVYDAWNTHEIVNITSWTKAGLQANATTSNRTVVDEIFGWTKKDNATKVDYPPVFAKYPKPFNTIMNHSSHAWGRDSIYLLGQGGADAMQNTTGQFVLCKIHVSKTPYCSTRYNATGSGGTMESLCEDDADKLAYVKSYPNATEVEAIADWRDIGFDWSNSLSLNTGIMDGDASNSRLLNQLIIQKDKDGDYDLSPALPSVAEAIAVMSGCTLLKSTIDAPFRTFWNYTRPMLEEPQPQWFNASVRAQQYASGGVDAVSQGWMIILLLVFLMNIFVLIYFLVHRGLVTDFSEPPNLFALAVNSPPSHLLAGSCGGGPEGKQYMVNWFVNTEGDHLYMEPGEKPLLGGNVHVHPPGQHHHHHGEQQPPKGGFFGSITKAVDGIRERGLFNGKSKNQPLMRPASVVEVDYEMEDGHTHTQRQYAKLAKRRSML